MPVMWTDVNIKLNYHDLWEQHEMEEPLHQSNGRTMP